MITQIISTLLYTWLAFSIVRAIYNRVKYPGYNSTTEIREKIMDLENKIDQQRNMMLEDLIYRKNVAEVGVKLAGTGPSVEKMSSDLWTLWEGIIK